MEFPSSRARFTRDVKADVATVEIVSAAIAGHTDADAGLYALGG